MVHLLLSLRDSDWSKFTLLRQMINYERVIELERIVGYQPSLFLQSINLHWALKNEVPFLLHYGYYWLSICQYGSAAIPFFTHLVSLIYLIPSNHTPWHVMNVTVDPLGKPRDVLIKISLYVNTFTPVILSWKLWGCGVVQALWGNPVTFCMRILCFMVSMNFSQKIYFSKLSILSVCHRMMWG